MRDSSYDFENKKNKSSGLGTCGTQLQLHEELNCTWMMLNQKLKETSF